MKLLWIMKYPRYYFQKYFQKLEVTLYFWILIFLNQSDIIVPTLNHNSSTIKCGQELPLAQSRKGIQSKGWPKRNISAAHKIGPKQPLKMAKASLGGHHPEVTSWGHLRPPGSLFAVVNLTCRSLPAKCHCWGHHSGYLRQHVSVSQDVHNLFSTQSFYRIFFFSNGFKFGTTLAFWSSQLHRENKKKNTSQIYSSS